MDSCCCSMNKYLIWGANFCVFALAVASLGVGIYALVDGEGLSDFLDALEIEEELNIIYLASIFIIVVSSFVLLITFLGCCGALKESRCLLGTYVFCVIVLIGAMIGGIALAASGTELVDLKTPLKETMGDYGTSDSVTKAWDDIQMEYDCCGVDGPQDWPEFNPSFEGTKKVPDSCCDHEPNQSLCISENAIRVPGCYTKFEEIITQNESLIFSIVSITLIALVANAALAIMMWCAIR